MNREPIHKNLNTSFVDLTALVRHLWSLQFVGTVHLELCGYEAEIKFLSTKKMQAREYDHQRGTMVKGELALKRILQRAREPHGRISVFRTIRRKDENLDRIFVDEAIVSGARRMAALAGEGPARQSVPAATDAAPSGVELAGLIAGLLETIDRALLRGNLTLRTAFQTACSRLSDEYPLLDPAEEAIRFEGSTVHVRVIGTHGEFAEGVIRALQMVFERMDAKPVFAKLFMLTRGRVRSYLQTNEAALERYGLAEGIRGLLTI